MDVFQIILLAFELMILAAIVILPIIFVNKVIRAIVKSTKKTYHAIRH